MNVSRQTETAVLDLHEPSWTARGYRLVRRPAAENLPDFLKGFSPDAILLGRDPKVVVEIVSKGNPEIAPKIDRLKSAISHDNEWTLEVVYAGKEPDLLPAVETERLDEFLTNVRSSISSDQRGSLLLLWAILEALARRLDPQQTQRPQTPGRVVELLAGAGLITPSQAERLREGVGWRNRLVHGDLNISPTVEQVSGIAEIVGELIEDLKIRETS
ncbi:MAG: HepT-like ribonuclease domain-containing protein [Pseudomonadota bacterium]